MKKKPKLKAYEIAILQYGNHVTSIFMTGDTNSIALAIDNYNNFSLPLCHYSNVYTDCSGNYHLDDNNVIDPKLNPTLKLIVTDKLFYVYGICPTNSFDIIDLHKQLTVH